MNILHIHQDYPDGRPYPYTKAVSNLIHACNHLSADDTHTVISINRTSNPFKVSVKPFHQGLSFVYWAIPLPFVYYLSMKLSAYFIYWKVKHLQLDIIHAHKLTCEGVFAYWLSKNLHIPYVVSIRGGSDSNNLSRLSRYSLFFKKIYKNAEKVFWVSAWTKQLFSSKLNLDRKEVDKSPLLPNICDISLKNKLSDEAVRNRYVTAISFHQYKRKGIVQTIKAIAQLKLLGKIVYLDVYGTGDKHYVDLVKSEIDKNDVSELICLKGQVSQQEILDKMKNSRGFLMPSTNETFGMSYIEALSVFCPILYVKNTGVDGYLDDVYVGVKITQQKVELIREAILEIENNFNNFQQELVTINAQNYLKKFTSQFVATKYLKEVSECLHK